LKDNILALLSIKYKKWTQLTLNEDELYSCFPLKQDTGSRHDFLNHVMPINLGRKQLPYLALKEAMAFPVDAEIQNTESIQERETADEENSAKFPIGRRDFDSKYISFLHKNSFILVKYKAIST